MHHTLLPQSERKAFRHEYRIRVLIVFCFTLSTAVLIGIVSLFPAYIRASQEQRANETLVSSIKKDNNAAGITDIQKQLARYQILMKALLADPVRSQISPLIEGVVSSRGAVRLTSMSFSNASTKNITVTLQGIAPTRDDLLLFKSKLSSLALNNKVELPISELARSSDIQFSVQFTEVLP